MTKLELQKKKTRDREATRQKLLHAAVKVFATQGYEGATTRAIADEAGVAEALIQRYFNGKQGLLNASLKDFADFEKLSCSNLPPPVPTLDAEWKSLLLSAVENCAHNKQNLNVAMSQATFDRNFGRSMAKFLESNRAPALAERLKKHVADGSLPANTDLEALSHGLALTMLGIGYLGQVVMKLDPKMIQRIVTALSKAYSSK